MSSTPSTSRPKRSCTATKAASSPTTMESTEASSPSPPPSPRSPAAGSSKMPVINTADLDYTQKNPDGTWNVEKIVGKRIHKGQIQWEVKWFGWPESDNTWESIDALRGSEAAIHNYELGRLAAEKAGLVPIQDGRPTKSPREIAKDIEKLRANKSRRIKAIKQMYLGDRMAGTINSYAVLWEDGLMYEVDENFVSELTGENRQVFLEFHRRHYKEIIAMKDMVAKRNLAIARMLDAMDSD